MPADTYLSGTGAVVKAIQVTEGQMYEAAEFVDGEVMDIDTHIGHFLTPFAYKGVRFQSITGISWAQIGDWLVKYKYSPIMVYSYTNPVFQAMFTQYEEEK